MNNVVSWIFKETPHKLELQDCDEVHITRDTVTIIYGEDKKKKVLDTVKIKDVTFYSYLKPPQTMLNSENNLNE